MNIINIAIDGPAGSGKSSVAKEFAKRHKNFIYVNTGAMFRAYALFLYQNNVDLNDLDQIKEYIKIIDVELFNDDVFIIYQNKKINVSTQIKDPLISNLASKISQLDFLRKKLLLNQQQIAKNNNVIMDGRDIGTVVLPNANLKVYLNASVEKRALRRLNELKLNFANHTYNFDQIKKEIEERDYQDKNRLTAPLKKAIDAIEINTDNMTVDTCCDAIDDLYNQLVK